MNFAKFQYLIFNNDPEVLNKWFLFISCGLFLADSYQATAIGNSKECLFTVPRPSVSVAKVRPLCQCNGSSILMRFGFSKRAQGDAKVSNIMKWNEVILLMICNIYFWILIEYQPSLLKQYTLRKKFTQNRFKNKTWWRLLWR